MNYTFFIQQMNNIYNGRNIFHSSLNRCSIFIDVGIFPTDDANFKPQKCFVLHILPWVYEVCCWNITH